MDNELVQTKGIIYSVAVLIVLDVISLFCPQKGFRKVLDLKHSYEFMELYQKYTGDELPSLERSFFSNYDLPDVQTNQESPQLLSGVQTQTQHQFWNAQSPGPQCTANLAPQTKSFTGGRSRTQAAHQMYVFGKPFVLCNSVGYSTKLHRQMGSDPSQNTWRNHPGVH